MSCYKDIVTSLLAGDIATLDEFAQKVEGFPAGKDEFVHRYWITTAIHSGNASVVEWMLDKGAPINFRDDEGYTVLHSALESEHLDKYEIMHVLIEAGADVNAKGINDWTPAHLAAVYNDVEALRILYDAGADFTIRTEIDDYATPLEEAINLRRSPAAVAYLQTITQNSVPPVALLPNRLGHTRSDEVQRGVYREVSYEWSPELVRLGTRRFIARYAGYSLAASAVFMILAILALSTSRAQWYWWVTAVLPAIYIGSWFEYYRQAISSCYEMDDRRVTVRLGPDLITFSMCDSSSTMKWSCITKIWRYPEVVLLFTHDKYNYSILPTAPLGEDCTRFIQDKVREHGGQVT